MQNISEFKIQRASLLFLLSLFTLPLLINPVVSLNFDDVFLKIKVIWVLAVILPSSIYLIFSIKQRASKIAILLLLLWIGWIFLAELLSGKGILLFQGAPNRLQGIPVYLTYAAVALAANLWAKKNIYAPDQLMLTLSWLNGPVFIYVSLQYYGLVGIISSAATTGVSATIAGATLGNRGYMAGCVALLLPLTASYALRSRLGLIAVAMAGFCITASMTRGAIVAALIGYLLWMAQGNMKRYTVHGALVIGMLLPLIHITPNQIGLRSFDSKQQLTDDSARTPLWHTALYGISLRPLSGWGSGELLDVMSLRSDKALLKELKVSVKNRTFSRLSRKQGGPLYWRVVNVESGKAQRVGQTINAVHNEYLEYAFPYGLPAAGAFLALFVISFLGAWKKTPWASASLASYMVYLLTWPETVRFAPLAWAVLGIALAAGPIGRRISLSTRHAKTMPTSSS